MSMRTCTLGLVFALVACAGSDGVVDRSEARDSGMEAQDAASIEATDAGARLAAGEQAVEIPAGEGLVLKGTLSTPERGADEARPGLVLVHGSGPQSRDVVVGGQLNMGFGFEIPVFAQLAARLTQAGFIVLRYDKRTCGPFNDCADNGYPLPGDDIVVDDFASDAGAALDWLRSQPGVRTDAVFVVGHSQGAQLVPSIAIARPWLRGGVVISGPYSAVDATLADQLALSRRLLTEAGLSAEQIEATVAPLATDIEQLAQLRAGTFGGNSIRNAPTGFWRSWMQVGDDLARVLVQVRQPLLIISGDYDWNVPASEIDEWRSAIAGLEDNPSHQTALIPCVTHALNCIDQPDYRLIQPNDIGREVSTTVIDPIVAYLRQNTP